MIIQSVACRACIYSPAVGDIVRWNPTVSRALLSEGSCRASGPCLASSSFYCQLLLLLLLQPLPASTSTAVRSSSWLQISHSSHHFVSHCVLPMYLCPDTSLLVCWVCSFTCVWRPEADTGISSIILHLAFEAESPWTWSLLVCQGWLASKPEGLSRLSPLPLTRITGMCCQT